MTCPGTVKENGSLWKNFWKRKTELEGHKVECFPVIGRFPYKILLPGEVEG
jgi:hypothetical protein